MTKTATRWRGHIGYYDGAGKRNGNEYFTVSRYGDGRVSLQATCEIDDDGLTRDIVLNLGADDAPIDAYVHTVEGGTLKGSGWYHFQGETCRASILPAGAQTHMQDQAKSAVPFFGTHALINDAWLARCMPRWGGAANLKGMLTCSLQANGGGVPGLIATDALLARFDKTRMTVPAGRFDTTHYQVTYGAYPPIDMWVSDIEHILVKMVWEPANVSYQLLSLTQSEV